MPLELSRRTPLRLLLARLIFCASAALPWDAKAALVDLPPIDRIVQYQPQLPLKIFTADGVELAQFGSQRREYVPLLRTPQLLQDALLAVEDARFREHPGVDPKGMARAALTMLAGGRKQGASTITQQLVRTMLLTRELSVERKTKEILLALKVEEVLSKDRILEIYLNEIYLGQRAYGFAAAAQTYFGKPMDQLSVAETAMLAGLPQNPSYANPVTNLQRAVKRQRTVLQRMHAMRVITDTQLAQAKAEPLRLRQREQRDVHAGHVAEMARRLVVERFGDSAYSKGILVHTSLLARDQRAAHAAVQRGVLAQDRQQPWRGPEAQDQLPSGESPDVKRAAALSLKALRDDDTLRPAMVLSANANLVRALLPEGEVVQIQGDGLVWAQPGLDPGASDTLKIRRGSVLRLVQNGVNWSISQWPQAEAALVSMDTQTGRVRALVGGFDFSRQPFNHATQGWRQPGSTIKPLLYSAALEARVMPATMVDNGPFSSDNGWRPSNSGNSANQAAEGDGTISVRHALSRSSNLASVRLLQHTGVERGREWLGRFGLDVKKQPNNLTLALGTGQATPLEMARAFATLANGGWRLNPVVIEKITDAEGTILFEAPTAPKLSEDTRVLPARNAHVMSSLLAEATRSGTAAMAQARLKRPDIHGKTGTTNKAFDAWFAGYQPSLAATVWMGHGQARSLGEHGSGARLALPIWIDYMDAALQGVPVAAVPKAPPGLLLHNGEWLYSEWLTGGAVASIGTDSAIQYSASPPAPKAVQVLFE